MDNKARNRLAIMMLIAAKVIGVIGIILGFTGYRVLGGVLLGADAVLLVVAVTLSLRNMKASAAAETDEKATLARMVEEGTLDQYLSDLREAKKSEG